MKPLFISILILILPAFAMAQRGKHGIKTIATPANIVNEYTTISADVLAGTTTITVANSTLNTTNRFPSPLTAGDLIMIIQIQGASVLGSPAGWDPNVGAPKDSTWGTITNYNNCGNWELAEVYSVPNSTTIILDCALSNNYTTTGKTEVVRIPRYSTLTIQSGGSITCDTWNGTIGGICAIEIDNNTTINAGGTIDVSGKGFRGGSLIGDDITDYGIGEIASLQNKNGAEKGESITGYQSDYNILGGRYCKGAPANGGGGGNAHNGGGGGGANGGNTLTWNGHGNPDNSVAGWTTAWNLQYTNFSSQLSSGGGQGGYTFSQNNLDPTTIGPNKTAWGGDNRNSNGGFGGRPLDYSTGKLFLGGGGGAGDQNGNEGGNGGNGGALVYLMNYGTISGAGQIISNGMAGFNSAGIASGNSYAGDDAAGGGGAGGTIIVNSFNTISGATLTANGGKGGNQVLTKGPLYVGTINEAEGPGGGGSGGYIAFSNGAPTTNIIGGANGTTNSDAVKKFLPNGATKGGDGTLGSVTNFIVDAANVTICAGQSAILTASIVGTSPAGTAIVWYDNLVAGNSIGTGSTYTVSPTLTTTYYVGTCPGTYHKPVIVIVSSLSSASAGADATICSGTNTTLNAIGGTGYVWSPTIGLSNPLIPNPIANPISTSTYVVSINTPCGTITDTTVVTVIPSINAAISNNTTICTGSPTTLTASGGTNYSWNTGATSSMIILSPTNTTTYSVIVGGGKCADTVNTTITVTQNLNATIIGANAICDGSTATLTATGGGTYLWNTNATTSTIVVTPSLTTNYSVTISSGNCSSSISTTVNVGSTINASIFGNTTLCGGTGTTLTAAGGGNYSWSTGAIGNSIFITPKPSSITSYSVIATSGSCADTAYVSVTSLPLLIANVSGNNSICEGNSTTLVATLNTTGAKSFLWNTGSTASTIIVTPTTSTTYTLTGASTFCTDTVLYTVSVNPKAKVIVSPNTTICSGQTISLNAAGGNSYSWNTGALSSAISISPISNSTYKVIAYVGACSDSGNVVVNVAPSPTVTTTTNSTICAGDIVALNALGGSSYLWSNGATATTINAAPSSTTTYNVIGFSANGCQDTAFVTITVSPPPSATILGNTTICPNTSTTLTASSGGTYLWSSGETTQSIFSTTSGTYSVIIKIGTCTTTASTKTKVVQNPTAVVSPDISIIQGQSVKLIASGGNTYIWDNGTKGNTLLVSPQVKTKYCVTAYDANNCYDTACTTVSIEFCSNTETIYFPNAFSPNGDGENDELEIYYSALQCIKNLYLVIYNRWGEKVYETSIPTFKWNGIYTKGAIHENMEGGHEVYVYYMNIETVDGRKISKQGNITLLK